MKGLAPLSPALVVAAAHALAGVGCGVSTDFIAAALRRCGATDGPWHTAFVQHVGYTAHYDADFRQSAWPLPATADCVELARFAHANAILAVEPLPGDILLLWSARESRFVRTGIVVGCPRATGLRDGLVFRCITVEGVSPGEGLANAPGVYTVTRRIRPANGHRFVRWADLDQRDAPRPRARKAEACLGRMLCAS